MAKKKKLTGSLKDRILKGSKLGATTLTDSVLFNEKEQVSTPVLLLNAALSSRVDGGLTSGVTTIAGESKTFKTLFGLLMVSSYLKKHEDAICLFYDSEFGSPPDYVKNFGIDMDRVIHCPIKNIEDLKFDCMAQLENLTRDDKVIIFIDSIGNLASLKEVEDALDGKSVVDMTRAKQLKSFFRMVTPYMTTLDIPMININHTYKSIGLFPTDVVGGGTGVTYSSDTVFIVKKVQEKDGTEFVGNHFDLFINKSRYVKEKSRVPIIVKFGEPLSPYTGLFQLAKEMGYITMPSSGRYKALHWDDSKASRTKKEIEYNGAFWKDVFANSDFADAIHNMLALPSLQMEEVVEDDEDEDS